MTLWLTKSLSNSLWRIFHQIVTFLLDLEKAPQPLVSIIKAKKMKLFFQNQVLKELPLTCKESSDDNWDKSPQTKTKSHKTFDGDDDGRIMFLHLSKKQILTSFPLMISLLVGIFD